MNRLVKYGALILFVSLFLGAMLRFPSYVMAYFVEPIAILFWAAWRIASSVNQTVYWAFLIVLCLMLMIRLLPSGRNGAIISAHPYKHESRSRVERWQALLKGAALGNDESANLRESLRNLLADMITQTEPSSPVDLKEALVSRQISLPPAARRYLFPSAAKSKWLSEDRQAYLLARTPNWLRKWAGMPAGADKATIHELLEWMESFMEINNER